jgi:hypothetical protein
MKIYEVVSSRDKKDFLEMTLRIYKNYPNWIRPLNKDIEQVFDPVKNKFFRHGKCTRFILKDDSGEVIGRIAAFINEKTSKKEEQPTGGIGFFECINDKRAAHILFDQGKRWLTERGMQAMDGPINFGERDSWWGLITEGFFPTPYKVNYNPAYYVELFESYGFKTYFEQWCYALTVHNPIQNKFHERHEALAADPDYRAEYLKKSKLEKYAEDFRIIYNKAWARHGGGKELDSRQVLTFFNQMKPVIDEKIIWFVYYKNEPVATWVNLPDINQHFKKFNGRFGIIEKLWFLWLFRRNKLKKFIGLVFGVIPEHQGKGVDSFMIVEGATVIRKETPYLDLEMQWIGDFNPKMVSVAENLGTYKSRVLKTYRYLFDPNKEFKRHPFL